VSTPTPPAASTPDSLESRQVPIGEAMHLAAQYHQAGRLAEAESIYRAVLQADADHPGATYNLALVALQNGRAGEALPVLQRALQREPGHVAHWLNCAVALAGTGQLQAARRLLLQARQRGFGGSAITAALEQFERMLLKDGGRFRVAGDPLQGDDGSDDIAELREWYRQGRHAEVVTGGEALWPHHPRSLHLAQMLGSSLQMTGQFTRARDVLAQAASAMPSDVTIQRLLASVLHRLRRDEEAKAAIDRTLEMAPDDFGALLLASANASAMRSPERALGFAERALALQPGHVEATRAMADALALSGLHEQTIDLYRRVIAAVPEDADLYINLGFSLTASGQSDEAVAVLERALELRPSDATAHSNLGAALFRVGETAAAREHHRAASDLAPERADFHTAYLFCLSHDATVNPKFSFEEHLRLGALIEAPRVARRQPHANDRDPERALRIGFVSGDLRDHAVAYLIEPVWRSLRQLRHHAIAYSNFPREDAVSERLKTLVDAWQQVDRLDDEALAQRIRDDRIDILFDLSGHTSHNRLPMLAMRPAPVQVSWIGYPGTTGMSSIDYHFVRAAAGSDGPDESLFVEKLVRLRHRGFQPAQEAPPVNSLPALSSGAVTFGSFNRPGKISDETVEVWSRVLASVPASRMLIAAAGDARMQDRLRTLFAAHGITPDRLEFREKLPLAEYLALHHEVDIALDSFPYSGSTTTSHALWMGVPVVTLKGDVPQQGQGAAFLLSRIGLQAWCTTTADAYVEQATRAAADLPALQQLRQQLRERIASVFAGATDQAAVELDAALRAIWKRWCAGLPPAHLTFGDEA
jgi:predicted O-linked N-acetylglucosamine transferase (SPINDLY family)